MGTRLQGTPGEDLGFPGPVINPDFPSISAFLYMFMFLCFLPAIGGSTGA